MEPTPNQPQKEEHPNYVPAAASPQQQPQSAPPVAQSNNSAQAPVMGIPAPGTTTQQQQVTFHPCGGNPRVLLDKVPLECPEGDPDRHPDHVQAKPNIIGPIAFAFLLAGVLMGIKMIIRFKAPWNGFLELGDIGVVITGVFFIAGQMLSTINADFKEAEKLPMDIVSSIEQIEDSFLIAQSKVADKGCSMAEVRVVLLALTQNVCAQCQGNPVAYSNSIHQLRLLPLILAQWDKKGAANTAPVIAVVDKVRRSISRARAISRSMAFPVGQGLLFFFVFMTTVILFLTSFKTEAALVVVLITVYTVLWLLVMLIHAMDDPFDYEGIPIIGGIGEVDLFPLTEYAERLSRYIEQDDLSRQGGAAH